MDDFADFTLQATLRYMPANVVRNFTSSSISEFVFLVAWFVLKLVHHRMPSMDP